MKKVLAREFLWLVAALVLAIPLGIMFLWLLGLTSKTRLVTNDEKEMVMELYILGFILSFVGIYLIRLITAAIQILVKRREAVEA